MVAVEERRQQRLYEGQWVRGNEYAPATFYLLEGRIEYLFSNGDAVVEFRTGAKDLLPSDQLEPI